MKVRSEREVREAEAEPAQVASVALGAVVQPVALPTTEPAASTGNTSETNLAAPKALAGPAKKRAAAAAAMIPAKKRHTAQPSPALQANRPGTTNPTPHKVQPGLVAAPNTQSHAKPTETHGTAATNGMQVSADVPSATATLPPRVAAVVSAPTLSTPAPLAKAVPRISKGDAKAKVSTAGPQPRATLTLPKLSPAKATQTTSVPKTLPLATLRTKFHKPAEEAARELGVSVPVRA